MKVDLVFSGGGVLGSAFVGSVCCLKRNGYEFERIAGTSVGSVIAALLAAGYDADEMKDMMDATDFKKLRVPTFLSRFSYPGQALSIIFNKGIYQDSPIRQWVSELLLKKGIRSFKHLKKNGEYKLKIVTVDTTQQRLLVFPDDCRKYGIDVDNFPVADAVAMSCAIPFFFTPIKLNYASGCSEIVDGGLLSVFPIWIFDVQSTPRWPTFGFKFKKDTFVPKTCSKSFLQFCKDVIMTPINYNQSIFVRDKDKVRTVEIDPLGISATDFDLTFKQKKALFNEGYAKTEQFLKGWSFERYKAQFANKT